MREVLFVINPNAGRVLIEEFEAALNAELAQLPPGGEAIKVELFIPETPALLRETLRQKFTEKPVDIVGVVGGDGTIMEVLPVLVEFPRIKLALIPHGTGNLLAVNLGIQLNFKSALDVLFNGQARRIDVGKIGTHYFALIAGVGTVAEIMENTPSHHKKRFGIWAYFWDGIRTVMRTRESLFKIIADGKSHRFRGVAILISNAASIMGPCLPLTPDAEPDDGLFDICLIKTRSRRDYVPAILEALGRDDLVSGDKKINTFRARNLRIESSVPVKVQADGNIIGTTPVDIELIRNRLQILVPQETFEPRQPAPRIRPESQGSLAEMLRCYFPNRPVVSKEEAPPDLKSGVK